MLRNPFELMTRLPEPDGPLFKKCESEATRRLAVFFGPRLLVISGAPGVGKSHRLVEDMDALVGQYGSNLVVTSKTHFAVNVARARRPEVPAMTVHKLIWSRLVGFLVKRGEIDAITAPRRWGRPEYFSRAIEPGEAALVAEYERDAGYHQSDRDNAIASAFAHWDPTEAPMPESLMEKDRLPKKCAFTWTLYQFCKWADKKWGDREDTLLEHQGLLMVDEAQDLQPIEALALGWLALFHRLQIVAYGDPQQAMDQDRLEPKLWQVANDVVPYYGDAEYRRVPYEIARLAAMVLPGIAPAAEEWCDMSRPGRIVIGSCADSAKLECTRGFNLSESRYSVATCWKGCRNRRTYLSPEKVSEDDWNRAVVISTPFGVKGYEHPMVTIQKWKPKHRTKYLAGDIQSRRRLYVSLTRAQETVVIHEDMLRMIHEGADFKWTSLRSA